MNHPLPEFWNDLHTFSRLHRFDSFRYRAHFAYHKRVLQMRSLRLDCIWFNCSSSTPTDCMSVAKQTNHFRFFLLLLLSLAMTRAKANLITIHLVLLIFFIALLISLLLQTMYGVRYILPFRFQPTVFFVVVLSSLL